MASFMHHAAPRADDLDARCERIRQRLLDGIDATLDELAQPEDHLAARRAAIADAVWAQLAPLSCRQATCRRARRCRRNPCAVAQAAALRQTIDATRLDRPPRDIAPAHPRLENCAGCGNLAARAMCAANRMSRERQR